MVDCCKSSFQEYSFPDDQVAYVAPSWNELEQLTLAVAKQIKDSLYQADYIVTLAKGGWPMTRSLVDFTGVKEIASIGVKFYSGINQRLIEPEIYQDLPIAVAGKKILLFDDVADSGGSLDFVTRLLKQRQAKMVKTATLFYKPKSTFKPDFFAATTSAWILFPFERVEMGKLLSQKWHQGTNIKEIKNRCKKLGLISPEKE